MKSYSKRVAKYILILGILAIVFVMGEIRGIKETEFLVTEKQQELDDLRQAIADFVQPEEEVIDGTLTPNFYNESLPTNISQSI